MATFEFLIDIQRNKFVKISLRAGGKERVAELPAFFRQTMSNSNDDLKAEIKIRVCNKPSS